jgi:zinc protease
MKAHDRVKAGIGMTFLLLVAVLIAGPVPVTAQVTLPDGVSLVTSVEGITEYRLESNGLRFLLFPDQSKPQTTVNITYFVGSRHEGYGETGMAHLLEHLVFKGTPDHPDIPQELTEHGARPNGTTWYDRTNYFERFPASEENLEWALDLEADRMVNSFISKDDLDSEMTVVRNELELSENNPFGVLMARVFSTAYLWHNYGKSTIGARSDVENVPIDRLQAFYRKYYQPDNSLVIVAGKFDEQRAMDLVVEKFGAIPRPDRTGANRIWPTYTAEPTQDGERSVTLRRVGDVQIVLQSYHVPPGSHEDYPAVSVLAQVLGDAPSGRLHKALVEPGLAAASGAFAFQFKEAGPLLMFAQIRLEDDLSAARAAMDEAIEKVVSDPPTAEEVERAKTTLLRQVEQSFNVSSRIALQLSEWAAMGDWRLFFLNRDRLGQVQPADVQRVATTYLKPSNRTVGVFVPTEEPDRAEIPAEPDVMALLEDYTGGEAVAEGEVFDPTPSNVESRITRYALANGMKVALMPKENRGDVVTVRLRMQFGDEQALMNRSTAGDLAGGMLMRGTANRTREEISDDLDRLKASGGISASASLGTGQFETTRDNLPAVIQLMGEIAREASFPATEFDQMKKQRLTGLEQQLSEPQALAANALSRHMSPERPKGHPKYVMTLEETIEAIENTTLEQAQSFYQDLYGPQGGNLVVIGDFDEAEVRAAIEDAFGSWESPHPYTRIASEFFEPEAHEISIETPDKANAFFMARQNLELRDDDPDYPALVVAGYMIGGGFLNSRLARRIRQQDGLSYGVGGGISGHPIDPLGSFSAVAIYAPENADPLVAAFREEIQKVIEEGFAADEVAAAKEGYLQQRQLGRSSDGSLAGQVSSWLYFDRDLFWDADLESRIRALTADQINEVVKRRLDVSKMTIIKAGDFEGAEKGAIGP